MSSAPERSTASADLRTSVAEVGAHPQVGHEHLSDSGILFGMENSGRAFGAS